MFDAALFLLITTAVLGARSFWFFPVWLLLLALSPVFFLFLRPKMRILTAISGTVVLLEIAWAVQFLPIGFLASGAVAAAGYYIITRLFEVAMARALQWTDFLEYAGVGGGVLLVVMFF